MPKLTFSNPQNAPIHNSRSYPYLAVTKLVVELPVANTGDRFSGGSLKAEIVAYLEIEDEAGVIRVYHPTYKRSIEIPNFEPSGTLLTVAAGLLSSQLPDLGGVEVVE